MRKPVFAICEQQRRRLACASAVSVAEQSGLSLTWSETPKTGFLMMKLICDYFMPYSKYAMGNHSELTFLA